LEVDLELKLEDLTHSQKLVKYFLGCIGCRIDDAVLTIIKYKKLTALDYCVRATKSHIQNSRNHFARTQSDRTTNWLPLQTM